jgi:DNA-binding winged helix-turn-helix (wHTH) protein
MEQRGCIFRFADIQVDESNFSVTKAGEVLPLEPKVFKVLQFLLHHADRVVTKDELLEAVWNNCSVSESSLTRSVAVLRRLLGDDTREPRYIATVPTVGYRFLATWRLRMMASVELMQLICRTWMAAMDLSR